MCTNEDNMSKLSRISVKSSKPKIFHYDVAVWVTMQVKQTIDDTIVSSIVYCLLSCGGSPVTKRETLALKTL